MKKHLIVIGMVVLLLAVGLSGCVDEKSRFIGSWEMKILSENVTMYTFNSDGTCEMFSIHGNGTYKIKDGKLFINVIEAKYFSEDELIYEYHFYNDGDKLILEGLGVGDLTLYKKES